MKSCIVVLSYNHPELTARAVHSALSFLRDDVILVHNGSEKKHLELLQQKFTETHHEILTVNQGYAGGVNAGFHAAINRGYDWIFLLTNDCEIKRLEVPSNLAPSQIAPLVHRRKQGKVDSIGACFTPARAQLHHLQNGDEFKTLVQAALKTYELKRGPPQKIPYIPGSAFWIHREVIEQTGVMDERLGTYWDDVDYSARVLEKGFPLLFQPQTEIVHQVGKTTYKLALYTTYFFQRNRRIISRRHVGRSWLQRTQLWWTLQTTAATVAARFLLNRDFKRLSLFLKALKDADRFK